MSHTAASLISAVTANPQGLNAAMSVLGTATATDAEAIALEITSMTDEQRAEALFAASLALGAAARAFQAMGWKPGDAR